MIYESKDSDFLRILLNDIPPSEFFLPQAINEALHQTEIFHYLFAYKLLMIADGEKFNIDLGDIDKKLDEILEQLKDKN